MDVDKPKKLCISQTLRDKELERIKSLGVVSVLNKNFNEAAPGPPRPASLLPALSPSNSLRTDNPSTDTSTKSRSRSVSRSQAASFSSSSKPASSSSLYNDYSSTISRTSSSNAHKLNKSLTSSSGHEDSDDQQFEPERKTDQEESLVVDSPIDTEKEILLKRVQELEALYNASIIDLQILESRNNSQKDILVMQDKLIQQMTNELDAQEINSMQPCQICSLDNSNFDCILKAQQDVAILTRELHEMGPLTSEYSSTISDLNEELTKHDQRIEELEHVAREIQKANATQTEFIDTKVQTLLDRILAKNAIINKLEHDQQQQLLHQQLPPTPKPEMIHQSNSITSLTDSSTLAYEQKVQIEQDEIGTAQESPNGQTMHISRWKGNPVPPASPPPSLPLPPIPSVSSRSISTIRRNSILSEITKRSSIYAQHTSSKHISADAVAGGELGDRRSLTRSDFDEELAEAAYYKEFTTQLQERLSVSKEIDDLRVWAPSDYDNIQRKISSKNWSDSDDELSLSSQKTAFWKGMKRKLKV